jgi:hypothetical protein
MKKRNRRRKISWSKHSRHESIRQMKIAVEANKEEVAVKDEDVDEVRGPMTTTTTKEEKAHPEVAGEEP